MTKKFGELFWKSDILKWHFNRLRTFYLTILNSDGKDNIY